MTVADFTELQYDILRETANGAMGTAGKRLAQLLSTFVELSIPEVEIVPAALLAGRLAKADSLADAHRLTAVRQTFYVGGSIDGEAVVLFDDTSPGAVARLVGVGAKATAAEEHELLLEMSNILISACLNGIARSLFARDVSFEPPQILAEKTDMSAMSFQVFQRRNLSSDSTLVVKIRFQVKKEALRSDLVILLSEQSIESVRSALNRIVGTL